MKNYLDVRATSAQVRIELELINNPTYAVTVDGIAQHGSFIVHWVNLLDPFTIEIEVLSDNSAVVANITVDGIEVLPRYNHLVTYKETTNYINKGKWALTFDRPFYQWLHQANKQGWLLEP